MLIDVDDFKQVNDTYGHLQGDAVLREISSRALRSTRKNDIIARYGGEELVAILPQTGLEGAIVQANRLLREVSEKPYPGLPEGKSVTVSIGVTVLDRQKTPDSEAFIQQADEALYDAKANGKNQISIWGADAQ